MVFTTVVGRSTFEKVKRDVPLFYHDYGYYVIRGVELLKRLPENLQSDLTKETIDLFTKLTTD
jgi:hypothetical protein